MNEKEFLKEHPSLDRKVFSEIESVTSGMTGTQWIRCVIGKSKEIVELKKNYKVIKIQDIHETQLDKQKVKEVICKYIIEQTKGISFARPINPIKLLKELGLE